MNAPANTPATTSAAPATEESKESALAAFVKSLGNAKANKSDQKEAAARFKAFQAKRADAEKALKDLEIEETEVSKIAIKAFGKNRLTVNGTDFVPTSRGERIFYKEMGGKGIEI